MVPLTDPAPRPVAIGYISTAVPAVLDAQYDAVTSHARAEGYALAQILTDRLDGFTISQIVDTARLHEARLVIMPADTTLATVYKRLTAELEPHGAACLVIGSTATTATERSAVPAAPRLTDALGRHQRLHEPRHAARTHP